MIELDELIDRMEQWAKAYPLDIFPEPDLKKAHALLKEGGMTLDVCSAAAMRHIVEGEVWASAIAHLKLISASRSARSDPKDAGN